jgi:hypothetical protein
MPNYFTLSRRSDLESGPVVLQHIDDEMRVHFGVPPDKDNWYMDWYTFIGLPLACGKTFTQIRAIYNDFYQAPAFSDERRCVEIIDWLDANFTSDAWARIGR